MFRKDWLLIALIVCILALMIIPLRPVLIDGLITLNMALSILLLMVGIYIRNPSDFSTFPSVILIGTAFRLSLSIGTTRLILTDAEGGDIIETFGNFVVGGSIAVGFVIFLIITVVQFLVVTKGAERVAEVAARFALDAMPGKQMAIDADIKAGTISAEDGDRKRKHLNKESQFFGAMDGAMKFVKGDAIAGLIIIVINLIGGIAVGVLLHDMTIGDSAHLFTLLTIGDGLVAQIPALLMALCAGVVVTRATGPDNTDLGSDISRELLADPRVPGVASVLVFIMGLVPGFPTMIFAGAALLLAIAAVAMGAKMRRLESQKEKDATIAPTADTAVPGAEELNYRFAVKVGAAFAEHINTGQLRALLNAQFDRLKDRSGVQFLYPSVEVDPDIAADTLRILLDHVPLVTASIPQDRIFVAATESKLKGPGLSTPLALNLPEWNGCHLPTSDKDELAATSHVPISAMELIVTVVFRLFERNIAQLFGRKEFDAYLLVLKASDAPVMDAVIKTATLPVLFRTFRALVSDGVPLQPASHVVESLHYWTQMPEVVGPQVLEDCLRGSLKRQICHALADRDGVLGVVLIDPDYEAWLRKLGADARKGPATESLSLPAEWVEPVLRQFRTLVQTRCANGQTVAIVIAADLRRRMRSFLASNDLQLPVLAPHELAGEIRNFPLEVLRQPNRAASPSATLGRKNAA